MILQHKQNVTRDNKLNNQTYIGHQKNDNKTGIKKPNSIDKPPNSDGPKGKRPNGNPNQTDGDRPSRTSPSKINKKRLRRDELEKSGKNQTNDEFDRKKFHSDRHGKNQTNDHGHGNLRGRMPEYEWLNENRTDYLKSISDKMSLRQYHLQNIPYDIEVDV